MENPKEIHLPFRETRSLKDFILGSQQRLADRLGRLMQPLFVAEDLSSPMTFVAKVAKCIGGLGMAPYPAQRDATCALMNGFRNGKKALGLVAEMGTGKTLMGILTAHAMRLLSGRPGRALILCPSHLVPSWEEELKQVYGNSVKIVNCNENDALYKLASMRGRVKESPEQPEFWLLGLNRAKLSCGWKPAYNQKQIGSVYTDESGLRQFVEMSRYLCPHCGADITDRLDELQKVRSSCNSCKAPLWQPDLRIRRWAPADYIKKHLKGLFDLLVADEVHMLKGKDTLQGAILGQLSSSCKKTLILTGTLSGGKASDIFYVLQRSIALNFSKEEREKLLPGYSECQAFIEQYGTLEEIYKHQPEDKYSGRASRNIHSFKEKPGISPLVLSDFFLSNCVFMRLSDIASELPPFDEVLEFCDLDPQHLSFYKDFETEITSAAKEALREKDMTVIGKMPSALLAWADRPQREVNITNREGDVVASVPSLPIDLTSKDERLVELMHENRRQGRKVLIYAEYTGEWGMDSHVADVLTRNGFRPLVMKPSVPTAKRLGWIRSHFRKGVYDCLICNARLVETGLNLKEFPEIIFYQTCRSTYTLRQASRRSYRPGQKQQVVVRYMINRETLQEKAMTLIASKLEASLVLEGELSDKGLVALSESGDSLGAELARSLVGSLKVGSLEETFASYRKAESQACARVSSRRETNSGQAPSQEQNVVEHESVSAPHRVLVPQRTVGEVTFSPGGAANGKIFGRKVVLRDGEIIVAGKSIGTYAKSGEVFFKAKPDKDFKLIEKPALPGFQAWKVCELSSAA